MPGPRPQDVLLRPIEEDDWPAVHAWASQERVCRYQSWGPNTTEQTREFVRAAAHAWTFTPQTRLIYVITIGGCVIGNCELNLRGRSQGEISYEGRMRETTLIRDGWRDSDLYSILVGEWHDDGN